MKMPCNIAVHRTENLKQNIKENFHSKVSSRTEMKLDIIKIKTETSQGLGKPKQQNKAQCCFLDKIRKNDETFSWTNKKGARTYKTTDA